ncbi:aspartate 1-decarboxylase [Streptomyces tendae]|uniref:aspartate 1-decarboxylase n=1 Tax=Streptomyces tendae TaxID=1932 RepID=UPI0037FBCEFE
MIGPEMPCKRSAIHNLTIDAADRSTDESARSDSAIREGIALPPELCAVSDLVLGEAVIVARIGASNIENRVHTFVVHSDTGMVEARGSVAHFLSAGDMVCIISETRLGDRGQELHADGTLPIVDYGIIPGNKLDTGSLKYERLTGDEDLGSVPDEHPLREELMPRLMVNSLITGLVVNDTKDDCLLGSAEIPGSVMREANMSRHTMVTVYNSSAGGATNTYAVPMPDGVIMTTGAMAGFAPLGASVSVASFRFADKNHRMSLVLTDGTAAIRQ